MHTFFKFAQILTLDLFVSELENYSDCESCIIVD